MIDRRRSSEVEEFSEAAISDDVAEVEVALSADKVISCDRHGLFW
jgi:hypothetical protein